MWNVLSKAVRTGLDILMPEKQFRICTADAPWMTQRVKALILKTKGLYYAWPRVLSIQVP